MQNGLNGRKDVCGQGSDVTPATVTMTLNDVPFRQICQGEKTVELRLNDEKRQRIREGDKIFFTRKDHPEDTVTVRVLRLYFADSFFQLFQKIPPDRCGFGGTVAQALTLMRQYYDASEEKRYGVVGLEFCVIERRKS